MFAATLGATAGNAQYASAISQRALEQALSFEETTTATTIQTVYGPMGAVETTTEDEIILPGEEPIYTDDDIEIGGDAPVYTDENGNYIEEPYYETEPTTFPETTVEVLYGPPSVLFNHGDLNMDRKLDARDLTLLKQRYLKGYTSVSWGELGDLDGDGQLTKKDIKMLERQLTGKPEDEDEDEDTTTTVTTTTTTTTTTEETDFWETYPQPVYGPPPAME
jgi:hypothetical protein